MLRAWEGQQICSQFCILHLLVSKKSLVKTQESTFRLDELYELERSFKAMRWLKCGLHLYTTSVPVHRGPKPFFSKDNYLWALTEGLCCYFFLLIAFICKPDEAFQLQTTQDMCGLPLLTIFAKGHIVLCQLLSRKWHQFLTFVF